jgi:hypothetical protein
MGDFTSSWDELHKAVEHYPGEPTDDAMKVIWIRHFTKLNITFDCGKHGPSEAIYDWL